MTPTNSEAAVDVRQTVSELQQKLHECTLERDEALAQQVATAEVMQVINSSPGELAPVFDAILEKATHLCEAAYGMLYRYDGKSFHTVALRAVPAAYADFLREPIRPNPENALGRMQNGERLVHIPDIRIDAAFASGDPVRMATVELGGARTYLGMPLRRDGLLVGAIAAYRQEVRPFSERQVTVLANFAEQAVIAMENARLFEELGERQAELRVTFDNMGDGVAMFDAEPRLAAWNRNFQQIIGLPEAQLAQRPSYADYLRLLAERGEFGTENVEAELASRLENTERELRLERTRADGTVIEVRRNAVPGGGFVLIYSDITERRRAEAEIRTARDAAEAALERQTATAEILQVINSSPGNLAPVFDAMLEKAMHLCAAAFGHLMTYDGKRFAVVAHKGLPPRFADYLRNMDQPRSAGLYARILAGAAYAQEPDLSEGEVYRMSPLRRALVDLGGARTGIVVALRKDEALLGVITIYRQEVRPFASKEITLLESFAAQAVIAIENARLIDEQREALEQQTATAEILTVISQSPTDVGPVLSAVARAAMKFCGASDALVSLREGDEWVMAAHEGPIETMIGARRMLTRHTAPGRAMTDGEVVQIVDLQSVEAGEFPEGRELGARLGFRSALAAPLLRDDVSVGAISLRRRQAGEFSPRQIELLKIFAAQAVIAIENVRLFTELRESLEQQTASAEILEVISQSPTDVEPVLKAVVGAARRFCGADDAMVVLREETEQLLATHEGSLQSLVGTRLPLDRSSATGRATIDGQTFHVPDVASLDPAEHAMTIELTRRTGIRSLLAAPMLREGQAIGCVLLRRPTPGAFTPRQIELLEAFAAQAVIAIENVRLFTELRDSLERLKAAQANLIQAEKMASLGQLTAGIAHEIKNPLNFVNNFAGLSVELLDELKEVAEPVLAGMSEDARAGFGETIELITSNLDKISEHGKRADGIVKSMLSHSRGGTGDWQESNINALVEEALNLAYHGARAQDKDFNVTLERDFAETRPIEVVPQDVTRVFLNLFGNGFYAARKRQLCATGSGYRPTLTVSTRDLGEAVEIKVRDNGTGIPPELRDKLFQPFFTTKPTGEGTGLGLSISYDIVTQQHGGTIGVDSEPGSFTEFTVRLPRGQRAARSRGR